ncbi:MAG: SusC/RagA family TonB-linked outer membrane protein, partial [Saprospiraceae bacterium]
KFFNNRVGLSATYFKEKKINEILSIPITSASGFGSKLINAGRIDRWGVELAVDLNPIKTRDLNWDVTLNFASIDNEVKELTAGITEQLVGVNSAFTGFGVRQVNVVGEKWGQLRGGAIKRDDQGRAILDKDGLYTAVNNQYLGSVLPDVTGGFVSQLTYKNFSFSFNIDYSFGGKYYSLSDAWGKFSGLFAATGALNDKGNNVRDDVSAGGGVKVEGVNAAGEPVTMYADGFNYFHQFVNRGIAEDHLFDLSFVKLREVSFGYSIPVANTSFAKFVQGATISLVARNPWLIYAQNRDFDPSELAGTFGENGQFPGTRSIGFNLKLQF